MRDSAIAAFHPGLWHPRLTVPSPVEHAAPALDRAALDSQSEESASPVLVQRDRSQPAQLREQEHLGSMVDEETLAIVEQALARSAGAHSRLRCLCFPLPSVPLEGLPVLRLPRLALHERSLPQP